MKQLALVVALGLVAAGCGGGSHPVARATTNLTSTGVATVTTTLGKSGQPTAEKKGTVRDAGVSVRAALVANHRLVTKVLWTNRVPTSARNSTRGPALAALAASARDRSKKGIRVRMIRDVYRIVSVAIGATQTSAGAVAEWDQKVVPSHLDGTPLGRPVVLHERARIELRRANRAAPFFVWKVTLIK